MTLVWRWPNRKISWLDSITEVCRSWVRGQESRLRIDQIPTASHYQYLQKHVKTPLTFQVAIFKVLWRPERESFDSLNDGLPSKGMTSAKPVTQLGTQFCENLRRSCSGVRWCSTKFAWCLSENIRRIHSSSNEIFVSELSNSSQSVSCQPVTR